MCGWTHVPQCVCMEIKEKLVRVRALLLPCVSQGFTKVNRHLYPLQHLTCLDISFINMKQTNR